MKPYPSCRYGHANVDATLALRAELGLKTEEIKSVTMGLPNKGMLLVGAPLAYKQNPQNVVDGQFSGPFVVACALAHGHFGWDSYPKMDAPELRNIDELFDHTLDKQYLFDKARSIFVLILEKLYKMLFLGKNTRFRSSMSTKTLF